MDKLLTYGLRLVGVLLTGLVLVHCGSGSSNNSSTTTAASYVTCPTTGYVTYNGYTQACTPGTTVYTGAGASTQICPTIGYIYNNGVNQPCTPGTTVTVSTINSGSYLNSGSSACQQYTSMYGIPYVLVNYGGQYECVRYDMAQYY